LIPRWKDQLLSPIVGKPRKCNEKAGIQPAPEVVRVLHEKLPRFAAPVEDQSPNSDANPSVAGEKGMKIRQVSLSGRDTPMRIISPRDLVSHEVGSIEVAGRFPPARGQVAKHGSQFACRAPSRGRNDGEKKSFEARAAIWPAAVWSGQFCFSGVLMLKFKCLSIYAGA
jgi:hypothetical protein